MATAAEETGAVKDQMTPLEVVEDIEQPTTDKRKYRYVRLRNGLQVLLVSEEEAEMSAAALDVNVGSFFDPVEAQGLAHFCEHMLFLGSASFPSEHEYANYIKQHGGMHNACTEQTHTTFFFSVAAAHLEGALERFAAFFVCPLFTAAAAAREAQAVDSEFRLRRANDAVRRWHLMHYLSNPQHPFSHFSCGNLASLTAAADLETGLRQLLLQFYNKWYSANIMTLTVLGKESLDELQGMVQLLFAKVENKGVPQVPSLTLLAHKKRETNTCNAVAPPHGIEQKTDANNKRITEDDDSGRGLVGGPDGKQTTSRGHLNENADEDNSGERSTEKDGAGLDKGQEAEGEVNSDMRRRDKEEEGPRCDGVPAGEATTEGVGKPLSTAGKTAGDRDAALPVFRPGIDLEKMVYVIPVKDFKEIHFQFVLPPLLQKWRTKPARFLGHLIGHEGKGSLLAALKKHALASGLNAWCLEEECVSIFHISIELTELGISDAGLTRVSELVLRYVQLLRAQPPAPWLFKEKQELAKLHFLFADKEDALSFCATHAKRLHLYPPQQTLSGAHLFFTYDAAEVQEVLQQLTLEHLRVELVGKRFDNKCDKIEAIYGVVYGIHDIPTEHIKTWTEILRASPEEAVAAAAAEGMHYPAPNPFIPTDLSLRSVPPETRPVGAVDVNGVSTDAAAATSSTSGAPKTGLSAVSSSAHDLCKKRSDASQETVTEALMEKTAKDTAARHVSASVADGEPVANGGGVQGLLQSPAENADQRASRSPSGTTAAPPITEKDVNVDSFFPAASTTAPTRTARGRDIVDDSHCPQCVGTTPRAAGLPVELRVEEVPALAGKTRFFFKQDDTFFLPKLSVRLWVSTAYSARGVREWMLSWVYVDTVALMLNEELYDADIAGLFYSLSSGDWPGEVSVALHGFNHKLPLMLHKLTYALAHNGHTQEEIEEDECGGSSVYDEKIHGEEKGYGSSRKTTSDAGEDHCGHDGVCHETENEIMVSKAAFLRKAEPEKETCLSEEGCREGHEKQGDREHHQKGRMDVETKRGPEVDEDGGKGKKTEGTSSKGLDRNMYDLVKESLVRRLKNRLTYRTVYQQAMTVCGEALEDPFYSYEEQIAALESIEFEEVEAVAEQLFRQAHVEGLAVGNMRDSECLNMLFTAVQNLNIQETGTNLSPKAVLDLSAVDLHALTHSCRVDKAAPAHMMREELKPEAAEEDAVERQEGRGERARARNRDKRGLRKEPNKEERSAGVQQEKPKTLVDPRQPQGGKDGGQCEASSSETTICLRVQQKNPNPEDYNNAAFLRLQLGELELRERAILALLSHWLEQPFFDEMRTQQQLGYVTQASKNVQLRTHTLDFFIASKYPPSLLASRMEVFLKVRLFSRLEELREELSQDLFELHRRALISELSVKPQNIYEETQRYVVEIYFKTFMFDRYAQTIKQLENLSRDECLTFIRHTLSRAPALMLWIHAQQQQDQQQHMHEKEDNSRQLATRRSDGAKGERDETDLHAPSQDKRERTSTTIQSVAAQADIADGTAPIRVAEGQVENKVVYDKVATGRTESKVDATTTAKKGQRDAKVDGLVAKKQGKETDIEGETQELHPQDILGKEWIDISYPHRLRDFAARRFAMPA